MVQEILNIDGYVNSIMENVPQVPFVVEQIGQAINIAKVEYDDKKLVKILENTIEVSKYAKEESKSTQFFKYHLIVISLLKDIKDMTKLKPFETQSNKIVNSIKLMQLDEKEINKKGFVRATALHLMQLFNLDQELFMISIIEIQQELDRLAMVQNLGVEEKLLINQIALIESILRSNRLALNNSIILKFNNLLTTLNKKFKI